MLIFAALITCVYHAVNVLWVHLAVTFPYRSVHSLCTLKMSPFRIKDVCDWEDVMTSVWILRGRPGHGQQRTDACGRGKDDSGQMLVEMGICLKIQGERKKL